MRMAEASPENEQPIFNFCKKDSSVSGKRLVAILTQRYRTAVGQFLGWVHAGPRQDGGKRPCPWDQVTSSCYRCKSTNSNLKHHALCPNKRFKTEPKARVSRQPVSPCRLNKNQQSNKRLGAVSSGDLVYFASRLAYCSCNRKFKANVHLTYCCGVDRAQGFCRPAEKIVV